MSVPGRYDRLGLKFEYPENWSLSDSVSDDEPHQVAVESPGGGMWSVYRFDNQATIESLIEQSFAALVQQYEDVEREFATETIEDRTLTGFDAFFYCLDFLVTARVRAVRLGGQGFLFLTQAESRDHDQLQRVFAAITTSLIRHQTSSHSKSATAALDP